MRHRLHLLIPLIYGMFPIISLYSQNMDQAIPSDAFEPVVALFVSILVLMAIGKLLVRDSRKMVLLVSLFVLLFFLHGYIYLVVKHIGIRNHWLVLGSWFAGYLALATWILRTKRDLAPVYRYVNAMGCFLMVFSLVPIMYYQIQVTFFNPPIPNLDTIKPLKIEVKSDAQTLKPEALPDIYYLVFDRYPSNHTLKRFYNYDNSEFLGFLEEKGFYIAPDSHANYFCTSHSLLSSLNMQHVNDLSQRLDTTICDWNRVYGMMEDHAVGRFLKSKGYHFINIGNWWRPTRMNRYADENIVLFPSEFVVRLHSTSALYPLGHFIKIFDYDRLRWEKNIQVFEEMKKIPENKLPTFTVAHVLLPHPPYLFDKDGSFLPFTITANRTRNENFLNQLAFTNTKLKDLIETILAKSERPPIILLQADEGPYPNRYETSIGINNPTNPWREATTPEMLEKTGIISAYYLPNNEGARQALYPSITPVNSFRIILNHYFHTQFGMLPDRIYMYPDMEGPCQFIDVTKKVLTAEKSYPVDLQKQSQ